MSWVLRWRNRTPRVTARRFVNRVGQTVAPTILIDSFRLTYAGDDTFVLSITALRMVAERRFKVKDECPHCVMLRCISRIADVHTWADERYMLLADYEFKLGIGIQLGIGSERPDEDDTSGEGWPRMTIVTDTTIDTGAVCRDHRR